jgi:hypothetical protein
MSELKHVEFLKFPLLADPLQVMIFDDASVVVLHFNTSKNADSLFEAEHWRYDNEDMDFYVEGRLGITENMKYSEIKHLTQLITELTETYNAFR